MTFACGEFSIWGILWGELSRPVLVTGAALGGLFLVTVILNVIERGRRP